MTPEKQIRCLLRARNTLVWVTTDEERRVELAIAREAGSLGYDVRLWDCASGATDIAGVALAVDGPAAQPASVFKTIRKRKAKEVWILRDLHDFVPRDPFATRGLKSLARSLQEDVNPETLAAIVVLTPSGDFPPALRSVGVSLDWPLPTREQIGEILDAMVAQSEVEINGERDRVIDAAAGLTATDMEGAFAFSIVLSEGVDPAMVIREKKRIIDKEKVLTWFEPDPRGLTAVGGLDLFKEWIDERQLGFTPEARAYGLLPPRGVVVAGVSGCGKSLLAKCIPTAWGVPLLRLDLGALKGGIVGESEANIRKALRVAEAVAPCVLWIDEIEKALGGSGGRLDGGVSQDQVGTILTWLQEHEGAVFAIATANDVTSLPPEMLRKGRWDDVFFVDLPTEMERRAILSTTLTKFDRAPRVDWIDPLAASTEGFSGAELAELIPTAMFKAFADGEREICGDDLAEAANAVVPLSTARKDEIDALREWAKTRARPASLREKPAAAPANTGGVGRGVLDRTAH